MLILAIDPGKTTGIAIQLEDQIITTCAYSDNEVLSFIRKNKWDLVIYENFASGGRISKYGHQTIRLIGKIVYECERLGLKTCVHQPQNRYCGIPKAHQYLLAFKHLKHEEEALSHLYAHELLKHP